MPVLAMRNASSLFCPVVTARAVKHPVSSRWPWSLSMGVKTATSATIAATPLSVLWSKEPLLMCDHETYLI